MITYSTCVICGHIMEVVDEGQLEHPSCPGPGARIQPPAGPPRLREAALYYAKAYGWAVFPLRPGTKIPATTDGFKSATSDPDIIETWWAREPNYNIGLATGHHFDVLDVDFKHGAEPLWNQLRQSRKLAPCHGIVRTCTGGLHIYRTPTGRGNSAGLYSKQGAGAGLDYRGIGGYVVAPPSTTPDGAYRWEAYPSPAIKQKR